MGMQYISHWKLSMKHFISITLSLVLSLALIPAAQALKWSERERQTRLRDSPRHGRPLTPQSDESRSRHRAAPSPGSSAEPVAASP